MNKIELLGTESDLQELLKFVKTKESDFDFSKIMPMPETIKNTERGSLSFASEAVSNYLKNQIVSNHLKWMMEKEEITIDNIDEAIKKWESEKRVDVEMGYRILENRKNHNGCGDWYEWAIENWGTKWEACEVEIIDNVICFDTAWTPSTPVIERLAELFPKVALLYKYFEPGVSLAGSERYEDGECVQLNVFDIDEKEYQNIAEEFGFEFFSKE